MNKDLSSIIERLEAFEERAGIELRGLYAYRDEDGDIHLNGEMHGVRNPQLECHVILVMTLYDSKGRVTATTSHQFYKEDFFGLDTFSEVFYSSENSEIRNISRICIFPKKYN